MAVSSGTMVALFYDGERAPEHAAGEALEAWSVFHDWRELVTFAVLRYGRRAEFGSAVVR